MAHLPVQRWGRDWLARGSAECRFMQPVYEGETVEVTATERDGVLEITAASTDGVCARATAALPGAATSAPAFDNFPAVAVAAVRAPADEVSLAVGTRLGSAPLTVAAETAAQYLRYIRETDPLYERERLVHPGMLLRVCNMLLIHNVVLGPWIHVGSSIAHLGAAAVDDTLSARARVTANYERKGHRFVDLDALVIADAARPVARVRHVAIYRPRQVAEAS
jgi:acyl dehydratase